MTDDQISQMVSRFLRWKLPTDFAPDGGISFKAEFNEHTAHPMRHEPVGTNLFNALQAEAMVRHMLGLEGGQQGVTPIGPPNQAPLPHDRESILAEATRIVTRDRAATHGQPENSFRMIAASWSAKLGVTVTPEQVCLLLSDLKACRAWDNPAHADNWVDLAGYAACGGELALMLPEGLTYGSAPAPDGHA